MGALGFLRPLDKTQGIGIEMLPETRFKPFARVREPIKIKVIAV